MYKCQAKIAHLLSVCCFHNHFISFHFLLHDLYIVAEALLPEAERFVKLNEALHSLKEEKKRE